MPFNGSGTFSRIYSWSNDAANNVNISSTEMDAEDNGFATGLSTCLTKDGQQIPTANLPMSTFRHTGVGNAVNRTDYAAAGQVQDSSLTWCGTAGGTANAITLTPSPAITAYAAGQAFQFVSSAANTGASTVSISSLGAKNVTKNGTTPLASGDIPSGSVIHVRYDGTQFQLINVANPSANSVTNAMLSQMASYTIKGNNTTSPANAIDLTATQTLSMLPIQAINDFRLTLTSATPVTTTDVTGATTIYCTPYKGKNIALFDGTNWNVRQSAEFSLALGTLTSGKPYDVFCYDNSGTPTLEFLLWTDDTTRATALAYQDGVLSKSGALTRRYMGTFYTTSTTTAEDSLAKRYLYNYYNRVNRPMRRLESTASWTYTTATLRQANASTSNQLNFLQGVAEDEVHATVNGMVSNSSPSVNAVVAIGVDSTSAATGVSGMIGLPSNGVVMGGTASYDGIPGVGRHYLAWLEYATATGTATWIGVNGVNQTGITGSCMA